MTEQDLSELGPDETPAPAEQPKSTVGTVAAWAKKHGISRQAAYKRIKEHSIPLTDGKLDFDRADLIFQFGVDPSKQRGVTQIDPGTASVTALKIQQIHLKNRKVFKETERLDIDLDRMRGELVPRAEVTKAFDMVIAEFKGKLLSMGADLRDLIFEAEDPIQVQRIIDDYIGRALSSVSHFRVSGAA